MSSLNTPLSFVDMLTNPEEFNNIKNFEWNGSESIRTEDMVNSHEFLPFLPNPELDMNMW